MPIILPPDLTDRTKAVNVLLQAIAEAPISDLETTESVEVAGADALLSEITNTVLSEGWHFNREEEWPLSPDINGNIILPTNCLWVGRAYWRANGADIKVVERGRKLYNRQDRTYEFDSPVCVDMVLLLAWEEVPEYARRYITMRAAKQFQGRIQGSATVDKITEEELGVALKVMQAREDQAERLNQIQGNASQLGALYGSGVLRRRRS